MTELVNELRGDETYQERINIAKNPDTHPDTLMIMALYDEDPMVLQSVKRNPAVTADLLEVLKQRLGLIIDEETMCPLLWNHISTFSNGDVRLCCEMTGREANYGKPVGKDGNYLNVNDNSFEDIRNSETAKRIRQQMMNSEKPNECSQCYHREKMGMESKRTGSLQMYWKEFPAYIHETNQITGKINTDNIPVRNLDLRFGNKCNLKCRSCGPHDSNLWYDDYAKMQSPEGGPVVMKVHGSDKVYTLLPTSNGTYRADTDDFDWWDQSVFWKDLLDNISDVTTFYFTGGEPTINKKHRLILEKCIELGIAKHITIDYNTNFHVIPVYLKKYWKEFKRVAIAASIDGFGPVQGYTRPPSNWDDISKNLLAADNFRIDQMDIKIAPTISIFNIMNLTKLADWCLENDLKRISKYVGNHMLYNPVHYNIKILPDEIKDEIVQQYNDWYDTVLQKYGEEVYHEYRKVFDPVLKFLMEPTDNGSMEAFFKLTKKLDEIRNETLETGAPELYQMLQKYNYV